MLRESEQYYWYVGGPRQTLDLIAWVLSLGCGPYVWMWPCCVHLVLGCFLARLVCWAACTRVCVCLCVFMSVRPGAVLFMWVVQAEVTNLHHLAEVVCRAQSMLPRPSNRRRESESSVDVDVHRGDSGRDFSRTRSMSRPRGRSIGGASSNAEDSDGGANASGMPKSV